MKKIFIGLVLVFAFSVVCYAEDFSGTWKGSFSYRSGGSEKVTLYLKQYGDEVKGTISISNGRAKGQITSGKVKGNKLKIKGKQTYPCSGTFRGRGILGSKDCMSFSGSFSNCNGYNSISGKACR